MTDYHKLFEAYMMAGIIIWIFFAKKPQFVDSSPVNFGSSIIIALLMPLWFIIFIPLFYRDRNKLRWIKNKWLSCATARAIDYSMGWRNAQNNYLIYKYKK